MDEKTDWAGRNKKTTRTKLQVTLGLEAVGRHGAWDRDVWGACAPCAATAAVFLERGLVLMG